MAQEGSNDEALVVVVVVAGVVGVLVGARAAGRNSKEVTAATRVRARPVCEAEVEAGCGWVACSSSWYAGDMTSASWLRIASLPCRQSERRDDRRKRKSKGFGPLNRPPAGAY